MEKINKTPKFIKYALFSASLFIASVINTSAIQYSLIETNDKFPPLFKPVEISLEYKLINSDSSSVDTNKEWDEKPKYNPW
jgi:hypothetical protein